MRVSELKGSEEIKRDVEEIQRSFLENMDPQVRLEGLGAEERLRGLDPEEEAKMFTLLLAKRERQQSKQ